MAVFGHSGSQAPQLMHSEVIIVAMAASRHTFPQAAAQARDGEAGAAGNPPLEAKKGVSILRPSWYRDRMRLRWVAVPALLAALVAPTRAQFDPTFNNLFCYGIHEQPGQPPFTPRGGGIATQLGPEQQVTVMRGDFLLAPGKKTGGGLDPLPPTAI